jgi:hypothetical protein
MAVAPSQQENKYFYMESGMRIMNWVQVFLCIRKSYQQLRELSLLVIGYIIHNTKRLLVSGHCSECSCTNRR